MRDDVAEASPSHLRVRVWGVRGSMPTPSAENLGHGGNTSCLQIEVPGEDIFIFDSGTGIQGLGRELGVGGARPLHLFFTHFHWDHLQGLPGFAPLYSSRKALTFYSARDAAALRGALQGQMASPYFPVDFEDLKAERKFVQLGDEGVRFGDLLVTPFALHHPGGSTGYRIGSKGHVVVYATDHEHGNAAADERLLKAAEGADTLFYDAQYTVEEYRSHTGWGHSTWLEATRVANAAGVKQLVLFHHDPGHDDTMLREIVLQAREYFPSTIAATEGDTLDVG